MKYEVGSIINLLSNSLVMRNQTPLPHKELSSVSPRPEQPFYAALDNRIQII